MQISSYRLSFGDITIAKASSLACIYLENQNTAAYVCQENFTTSGNTFSLSHRGTIPCIVCENEISNQCLFSKTKRRINANMEFPCLGRHLLRLCDMLKFGRNCI